MIVVHSGFDGDWPFAADHFRALWEAPGRRRFVRLRNGDGRRLGEILAGSAVPGRLVALGVPVTRACLEQLAGLKEAAFAPALPVALADGLAQDGVQVYTHPSEG